MRTMFIPFYLGLVLSSSQVTAQISFKWKADSGVEVAVGGSAAKGWLKEGAAQELNSLTTRIWLASFSISFVAVAWAEQGKEQGFITILERQNSRYWQIVNPIRGHAETLVTDLQAAVANLEKANGWDQAMALRALIAHYNSHPNATLTDIVVATQEIKVLAKPDPKGLRTITRAPIVERSAPANAPLNIRPRVQQRPTRAREPLPYEPRFPSYRGQ